MIAEVVKPEDADAIATAGYPVLAVLNKADLTGFGGDGPIAAAVPAVRSSPSSWG